MPRKPKITEKDVIYEILQELYKNADPPADFMKLAEEAEWYHTKGVEWVPLTEEEKELYKDFTDSQMSCMGFRKKIDFDAYKVPEKKFDEIVQTILEKYKKKFRKYELQRISATVYLGPCPNITFEKNLYDQYHPKEGEKENVA